MYLSVKSDHYIQRYWYLKTHKVNTNNTVINKTHSAKTVTYSNQATNPNLRNSNMSVPNTHEETQI